MKKLTGLDGILFAGAFVCLSGPALAQTSTAASGTSTDTGTELQEVTVTGTHITDPNFVAPTPVTSLSQATIEERAPVSITEVVNQLPAFRITRTPDGIGRISDQQSGVQGLLDLRGLGAIETLVLIDGKRTVGTTSAGTFDTNMIPVGLVDRVDVVTGGASAAYGSDAVAGVVNFVLKKKFEGLTGSVQTGISQYGDGAQNVGSLAGGFGFNDDRGHVIFGVDLAKTNAVGSLYTRPEGRLEPGIISLTGPQRVSTGLPAQVFTNGVELANSTPGSLIVSPTTGGKLYGFTPAGTPFIYNQGSVYGAGTTANMIGSNANYGYNPNSAFNLQSPNDRSVAYGRFQYDLTPSTDVYAEVNYGHTYLPAQTTAFITTSFKEPVANLPASIASQYAPGSTVTIDRLMTEQGGGSQTWQTVNLGRWVLGAEGKLFNDKWNWDVSYEHGRTHQDFNTTGIVPSAFDEAVDGCNATLTNPNLTAGLIATANTYNSLTGKSCVAFNPFGVQNSAAAISYIYNNQHQDTYLGQDDAAVNLSGSPVTLWAGDLSMAVGAEWRRDTLSVVGTTLGIDNVYSQGNFGSDGGTNQVKEAYLEAGLPLLKDLPFARALDINGAVRRTDYKLSGAVTTWKEGATYKPVDGVMLRVTESHDIRAPNLNDLFFVGGALPGPLTNAIPGTFGFGVPGTSITSGQGNPNLLPEKANTFTSGIVLEPVSGPLSDFRASVDYYHIKIKGAIARLTTAQTQNVCAAIIAAGGTTCPGIVFNTTPGGNGITSLANYSSNLNALISEGWDIELGYRVPSLPWQIPGSFAISALLNHAVHDQQALSTGVFELAGSMGGVPSWNGNLTFAYEQARFGAEWQLTGFTGVKYNTSSLFPFSTAAASPQTYTGLLVDPSQSGYLNTNNNSINLNHFGGMVYSNLSGHYDLNNHFQLFAVINNVFNRQPPAFAAIAETSGSGNINYDLIGRFYKFGGRFNF